MPLSVFVSVDSKKYKLTQLKNPFGFASKRVFSFILSRSVGIFQNLKNYSKKIKSEIMRTSKYFTRTSHLLSSFNFRTKKDTGKNTTNELIHPRFVTATDNLAEKKVPNSLLYLMYSEENETLFI